MSRADADSEGVDGAVPVAAHGLRPDVLAWKTRRRLLFQVLKTRYLVGTNEAVIRRILGRYVGLRRDPKFIQALDVVRPPWAPPRSLSSPRMLSRLLMVGPVVGVELRCRRVGGTLVLQGGRLVCRVLPWGTCPPVGDAAVEVQNLVNLSGLSGASGVYLVRPPVGRALPLSNHRPDKRNDVRHGNMEVMQRPAARDLPPSPTGGSTPCNTRTSESTREKNRRRCKHRLASALAWVDG